MKTPAGVLGGHQVFLCSVYYRDPFVEGSVSHAQGTQLIGWQKRRGKLHESLSARTLQRPLQTTTHCYLLAGSSSCVTVNGFAFGGTAIFEAQVTNSLPGAQPLGNEGAVSPDRTRTAPAYAVCTPATTYSCDSAFATWALAARSFHQMRFQYRSTRRTLYLLATHCLLHFARHVLLWSVGQVVLPGASAVRRQHHVRDVHTVRRCAGQRVRGAVFEFATCACHLGLVQLHQLGHAAVSRGAGCATPPQDDEGHHT